MAEVWDAEIRRACNELHIDGAEREQATLFVEKMRTRYTGEREESIHIALQDVANGVGPFLAPSNEKVKAPVFDLPIVVTCKQECSYCYAKQAELSYFPVRVSRLRNLLWTLSPKFPDAFHRVLDRRRNKYVRLHSSGDFYSGAYFDMMVRFAWDRTDKKFWAYTQFDDFNGVYDAADVPDNFTLIHSLYGVRKERPAQEEIDFYLDKGFTRVAWVADGIHVWGDCPAVADHKIKCVRHCTRCIDSNVKVVGFTRHGRYV